MKHLTILSVSVTVILFAGAQFQNKFNNTIATTNEIEKQVKLNVINVSVKSDSTLVNSGKAATLQTINCVEQGACKMAGKIVNSVF